MSWSIPWECKRPGCDNKPWKVIVLKDTKYNFHYPVCICWDCDKFLQLG